MNKKPGNKVLFQPRRSFGVIGNVFDALLEQKEQDDNGATQLEAICQAMINKAKTGDVHAANTIFDRVEGKPTQMGDFENATRMVKAMSFEEIASILGVPASALEKVKAAYALVGDIDTNTEPEDVEQNDLQN